MFVFILVSLFLFCFTSVNITSISSLDDTDHDEPYDFIDYRVLNAG